jgi:hypothetical protein
MTPEAGGRSAAGADEVRDHHHEGCGREALPAGADPDHHDDDPLHEGRLLDIAVTTGGADSKRNKRLLREGFRFVNVTMNAREASFLGGARESPYIKLSPSYPVSMVPVPFELGGGALRHSETVEGMWQGLKLVNGETDLGKFEMTNAWNLKRKGGASGRPSFYFGEGRGALAYAAARREIYVPAYLSVLENQARDCVEQLRAAARVHKIALVDHYKHDMHDLDEATHGAFSHACVLRKHLLGLDPLAREKDHQEGSSSPGLVPAKKDRSRRIVIATAIGDEKPTGGKPTGGKPTGGRARAKRRRKAERGSPASSELNSAI